MSERSGQSLSSGLLLGVALGVVVLWLLAWWGTIAVFGPPTDPGQFGDMFGSINALFSGLALAGVVLTLFMQHHELGLQRRELALTRDQLTRTAAAQEASEGALARQALANERAAEIAGLVAIVDHYGIRISSEGRAARKLELERERDRFIGNLAAIVAPSEELGALAEDPS